MIRKLKMGMVGGGRDALSAVCTAWRPGLTHNYTGYPMVKEARELVQSGALGTILGPCLWINERSISKSTLGAPSRERINRWYVQYPPTARATAVATDDMHTKRSGDIGVFIKISVV
jgi:hypothetical protein